MELKFQKYSSIDNSYNEKYMDMFKMSTLNQDLFYLQEKIHGTNLSFYCDGNEVRCGKRSCLLDNDANFFGFKKVKEQYEDKVMALFKDLNSKGSAIRSIFGELAGIILYGEMFGGHYNHPDVEKVQTKCIQKGVSYHPRAEFMAFDLKIVLKSEKPDMIVDLDFLYSICKLYGIPTVPVFLKGDLQTCLAEPVEGITSLVPEKYGLPEIEDNFIEGYVLKPNRATVMGAGARAVLKIKTKKFLEKRTPSKPKVEVELPRHLAAFVQIAEYYINRPRYDNVTSKEDLDPKYDVKCMGKVIGLFNKDVIEDFIKDNPDFNDLDKSERKVVTKKINAMSATFIKDIVFNG